MQLAIKALVLSVMCCGATRAADVTLNTTSDDRWHYPFNFTPGLRPLALTFGAFGLFGFNDRDGILLVAWTTSEHIPTGQGVQNYNIGAVACAATIQEGADWPVDITPDEWYTFDLNLDGVINADGVPRGEEGDTDGESDDLDPGRALELFGVGFGPNFTPANWHEASPYVGSESTANIPRDPYPFVFDDETGQPLHVEDNIKGLHNESLGVFEFTPVPWSVGVPQNYTPGAQSVPFDVIFNVDLNLSNGAVKQYFAERLNAGRVILAITSPREAAQQDPTGLPTFFTKEAIGIFPNAKAPSLTLRVVVGAPNDFDEDGDVDLTDYGAFVDCLNAGGAPTDDPCEIFDAELDEDLDLLDFARFQATFDNLAAESPSME